MVVIIDVAKRPPQTSAALFLHSVIACPSVRIIVPANQSRRRSMRRWILLTSVQRQNSSGNINAEIRFDVASQRRTKHGIKELSEKENQSKMHKRREGRQASKQAGRPDGRPTGRPLSRTLCYHASAVMNIGEKAAWTVKVDDAFGHSFYSSSTYNKALLGDWTGPREAPSVFLEIKLNLLPPSYV